jgi:hypothetical protein
MHSDLMYVRSELRIRRRPWASRSQRIGGRLRYRTDGLVDRMALTPTAGARRQLPMRAAARSIATSKEFPCP